MGGVHTRRSTGFTLIELMVTIAIIGVMSSVATAGYQRYFMKSKASEALSNLGTMAKLVQTYYASPKSSQGMGATAGERCVPSASNIGNMACAGSGAVGSTKQALDCTTPTIPRALGFTVEGLSYFGYAASQHWDVSLDDGGVCNPGPNIPFVFHIYAASDLDADGKPAGIGFVYGTDGNGDLRHYGLEQKTDGFQWQGVTFETEY